MLLAIDVGNTNITVGIFRGSDLEIRNGAASSSRSHDLEIRNGAASSSRSHDLVARGWIPTGRPRMEQALGRLLRKLKVPLDAVDGVILSSVVPRATAVLKPALKKLVKPKPLVLGENVRAPVINRYRVPSQVGQDRLVNAAAAFYRYRGPAIVVDFGTAVTIDLVNNRREYLGGLIVPGIGIGLEALAARTALLPKVKPTPPKEFLGRDTVSSMRSGIFFGYGALCDGIVRRMKIDLAPRAKVIATGGHAALIAPFCRTVQIVNSDLTLQGLELTYRLAQKIS